MKIVVLKKMHWSGLALLMLCLCSWAEGETTESDMNISLNEFLEPFYLNKDFSGIVAISESGKVIGKAVYGYADIKDQRDIGMQTTFHVASISKTFTAAAIRDLNNRQLLKVDDQLEKFLPGFPNSKKITLRHLLNHQSGIPDYWRLADVNDYASQSITLAELLDWLGTNPLDFEPGSGNAYSNSGYAVLAAVIEKVSGLAYHDYLARHIYPQAGLSATAEFSNNADTSGYSPAYSHSGVQPNVVYDPSILIGAGSLKSTAGDLLAWCESFIDDFVDPETPVFVSGWGVRMQDGRRYAEQTGRNPGFAAHIRAYPDTRHCLVVLSNIESESVRAIGDGVAAMVFGDEVSPPEVRPNYQVSASDRKSIVGRFEITPGNVVEVIDSPQGLLLKGHNGVFLPLEPIAKDTYFYRQLYAVIGVEKNAAEAVTALLWGGSYRMPRIE